LKLFIIKNIHIEEEDKMSKEMMINMKFPFEGKEDFDNESFYYFLPHFNPEKKKKIGEKITQFKGVILYFIFAI
jgi:hypothetical protein